MSDCRFTEHALSIHWSSYSTVSLLLGWCHVKLLPSRHKFCVHHATMHQFTVSLYFKLQMYNACVLSCDLAPARLAEWQGCFTCYCGNTGMFAASLTKKPGTVLSRVWFPSAVTDFSPGVHFNCRLSRAVHTAAMCSHMDQHLCAG